MHEDHKAPIVAVNVWYHVGSKNEKPGRTGFAHLFEHLMFNGSENFNDDYFKVLEGLGATDLNGTTNEDRTNYFQNVPTSALDTVLWMESDRMGHLLGAITQAKLDEQRGVVQNEKRQGENEPYGRVDLAMTEAIVPEGASVLLDGDRVDGGPERGLARRREGLVPELLRRRQRRHRPGRATSTPETAREKVEKYFGDIPSGPAGDQAPGLGREAHGRAAADHAGPRPAGPALHGLERAAPWGTDDMNLLDLAASVLAGGKTSRLYKRLVYDEQIATSVSAYARRARDREPVLHRGDGPARRGPAKVEAGHARGTGAACCKDGPTAAELERVKTQFRASFIRGVERIGGFGGKSDVLAQEPGLRRQSRELQGHARARAPRPPPQQCAMRRDRWLSDGLYVLEVQPVPRRTRTDAVDGRSQAVPKPGRSAGGQVPGVRAGDARQRPQADRAPNARPCPR